MSYLSCTFLQYWCYFIWLLSNCDNWSTQEWIYAHTSQLDLRVGTFSVDNEKYFISSCFEVTDVDFSCHIFYCVDIWKQWWVRDRKKNLKYKRMSHMKAEENSWLQLFVKHTRKTIFFCKICSYDLSFDICKQFPNYYKDTVLHWIILWPDSPENKKAVIIRAIWQHDNLLMFFLSRVLQCL